MEKNKKELEWRNHSPFFVNLNDDLKRLKLLSSNKDLRNLRKYFNELKDMKIHYSVYISSKELNEKLKACNEVVYSTKYDLPKYPEDYYIKLIDTRDTLEEIHELIVKGLFDNGLIPRFELIDTSGPAAARQKR